MKLIKIGLLALTTFANLALVQAQTAEEIIARHIEAVGGKEKISKINSMYIESSFEVMGNEAPSTTIILNGKGFKNEMDFNGQKIVQCITDKGGWMINPMSGSTTATPMPDDQVKSAQDQLYIGGPLFNYAEKGSKVELMEKEDVQGKSSFKIKVISKDKIETTFFLNPETFYVVKMIRKQSINGQEMETTALYSDFKKTDYGFVLPFSTELQLPQFTLKHNTKKVEINKPVDESVFKAG